MGWRDYREGPVAAHRIPRDWPARDKWAIVLRRHAHKPIKLDSAAQCKKPGNAPLTFVMQWDCSELSRQWMMDGEEQTEEACLLLTFFRSVLISRRIRISESTGLLSSI